MYTPPPQLIQQTKKMEEARTAASEETKASEAEGDNT